MHLYCQPIGQYLLPILLLLASSFVPFFATYAHEQKRPSTPSPLTSYTARGLRRFGLGVVLSSSTKVVNVNDFGAKGDGHDDSEAFTKAWKEACSSEIRVVIVIPRNTIYNLRPVTFSGSCKSEILIQISGTIEASVKTCDYDKDRRHWLVFENVQNLSVEGGGTIDGNGRIWWQNSCKVNKSLLCTDAPYAVTFMECKNVIETNIRLKNAQKMHLVFQKCEDVRVSNLMVTAPGHSPNTDGIHVSETKNIRISNCAIMTGDDCISIVSGSNNVQATDITCGPGHGISIGSLGAGNSEAEVSNVLVDGVKLSGTTNGVRIKTWQGGSGYAKSITFKNVVMRNVTNPIIINQNYCDQDKPCKEQLSAVQVGDVVYRNIRGTSASEIATNFDCSKKFPCQGILLQNINLTGQEGNVKASCVNVKLVTRGFVSPQCSS